MGAKTRAPSEKTRAPDELCDKRPVHQNTYIRAPDVIATGTRAPTS